MTPNKFRSLITAAIAVLCVASPLLGQEKPKDAPQAVAKAEATDATFKSNPCTNPVIASAILGNDSAAAAKAGSAAIAASPKATAVSKAAAAVAATTSSASASAASASQPAPDASQFDACTKKLSGGKLHGVVALLSAMKASAQQLAKAGLGIKFVRLIPTMVVTDVALATKAGVVGVNGAPLTEGQHIKFPVNLIKPK